MANDSLPEGLGVAEGDPQVVGSVDLGAAKEFCGRPAVGY